MTKIQSHLDEQALDEKLAVAFHDVAIPLGLVDRIFDCLAQAPRPRKVLSRRLLLSGVLVSAAAVLFVALWLNLHDFENYTEQTVLDEAIRFFYTDTSHTGIMLAEKAPPKAYPLSRSVLFTKSIRWREIRDFLGRSGIAYDLPGSDGVRATLYVIEKSVQALGNEPRLQPFTTGGFYTSAWQENGLLYVLVVHGELQSYQNRLNLRSSPVA